MKKFDTIIVLQVLLFVGFLATGNIVWKFGLNKMGGFMTDNYNILYNMKKILISPYMWVGILLYGVSTLWWFYLMSKENISYLYPLASIGYVVTMLAGIFLFNEAVPSSSWIGMTFVVIGFIVMTFK